MIILTIMKMMMKMMVVMMMMTCYLIVVSVIRELVQINVVGVFGQ